MLTGCPLMAVPLPLRHGPAAAAAVGGMEVIIALPLSLQPQLVPVVLDVRLLLQSQVHLQRGKSTRDVGGMKTETGTRFFLLCVVRLFCLVDKISAGSWQ